MAENLPWHKFEYISLYKCFTSVPVPFLDKLTTQFLLKTLKERVFHCGDFHILEKITSMQ